MASDASACKQVVCEFWADFWAGKPGGAIEQWMTAFRRTESVERCRDICRFLYDQVGEKGPTLRAYRDAAGLNGQSSLKRYVAPVCDRSGVEDARTYVNALTDQDWQDALELMGTHDTFRGRFAGARLHVRKSAASGMLACMVVEYLERRVI